ncbi:hypothetical protein O1L44_05780 [Streptomyces noursei]|nr:hypothetical protein [Streptomyces noursei]
MTGSGRQLPVARGEIDVPGGAGGWPTTSPARSATSSHASGRRRANRSRCCRAPSVAPIASRYACGMSPGYAACQLWTRAAATASISASVISRRPTPYDGCSAVPERRPFPVHRLLSYPSRSGSHG